MREMVSKLETNRGWLEERVVVLENTMDATNYADIVVSLEETGEPTKLEK